MDSQITERVNIDRVIKPSQSAATRFSPPTTFEDPRAGSVGAPQTESALKSDPAMQAQPQSQVASDVTPLSSEQPSSEIQQSVLTQLEKPLGVEPQNDHPGTQASGDGAHHDGQKDADNSPPAPQASQPQLSQAHASSDQSSGQVSSQTLPGDVDSDPELKKMAEEYWRQVEESQKENNEPASQASLNNSGTNSGTNSGSDSGAQSGATRDERVFSGEIGVDETKPSKSEPSVFANQPPPIVSAQTAKSPAPAVKTPELGERKESVIRNEERRDEEQRSDGWVISCDANYATILANCSEDSSGIADFWAIGKLITVHTAVSRLIGMVYKVHAKGGFWKEGAENSLFIEVELMGELTEDKNGFASFAPGIANYPTIGCMAHRIRSSDLHAVHNMNGVVQTPIGVLSQDHEVAASICLEKMISSHFAVVGTTGAGKSTSVSLLIRKLIDEKPDLRVLILDPHNEFAKAFPNHSVVIDLEQMQLPYWMFQFEEVVEVIFRGRKPDPSEVDALRDLIPMAKTRYADRINGTDSGALVKKPKAGTGRVLTVDTPVPYKISDLIALIEEELGRLEGRHEKSCLKALKGRILSLSNDPRFAFLFPQRTVEDNMAEVISQIFRIPHNNRPITTFELSGIPSEVTNVVVSVLSRLAFDLAVMSKGSCEVLVLCEEAHRYVPANTASSFEPTRIALARIAKEGRKYGAYLGIITQRPSELDPTILSQCSTVFAMRLANAADQEIIRSAISNSSASTINFLSSIGNREAIAFGAGVATPMRMKFADIPSDELPESPVHAQYATDINGYRLVDIRSIISKMRASINLVEE